MARLNIEDRAFSDSRIKLVAYKLGLQMPQLLGHLSVGWHVSQELERQSGSKDEILCWFELYDEELGERFFTEMLRVGLIQEQADGQYKISGNEEQLSNLKTYRERAIKGGLATKRIWKKKTSKKASSTPSTEQDITKQDNLITRNKERVAGFSSEDEKSEKNEKTNASASALTPLKGVPKKWLSKISDFDREMGSKWLEWAKSQVPSGSFHEGQFQASITRMRHEWKLAEKDIESLLGWCQDSEFWSHNAISPTSLLRRKGEKTKLDTILLQKSQQKLNKRSSEPKTKDADTLYKEKVMKEIAEEQRRRDKEWGINQGGCDDNDPW